MRQDGAFRLLEELRALCADEAGPRLAGEIVAYCRIGERSSPTGFVLTHLLGFPRVRNYGGSWTEWVSLVAFPSRNEGRPAVPGVAAGLPPCLPEIVEEFAAVEALEPPAGDGAIRRRARSGQSRPDQAVVTGGFCLSSTMRRNTSGRA